jgi:hypothetical protein
MPKLFDKEMEMVNPVMVWHYVLLMSLVILNNFVL